MPDSIRVLPKGYSDTPILPGSKWRIHDVERPEPPIVTPGSLYSTDSSSLAPADAIVLFDGSSLDEWQSVRGGDAKWRLTEGNAVSVEGGTGDIRSRREFGSCQLHVEWSAPTEFKADSQGRGNSGVFLMGLYEIQVLDSYENPTYADGHAGAIYGQFPPLAIAMSPRGQWNVFDIVFEAPEYQSDELVSPATMTLLHNGVLCHLRQVMQGPTKHRELASYATPHGPRGPVVLQDHGDPVRFRNIWIRELDRVTAV